MAKNGSRKSPEHGASLRVVHLGDDVWGFDAPRVTPADEDCLDDAVDEMEGGDLDGPLKSLRALVARRPEFIDARHHLAFALEAAGKGDEAFEQRRQAVADGLAALPPGFVIGRHRLLWGVLENRGFLGAYFSLGMQYEERGLFGEALSIYRNLLDLNPPDNQGVRGSAVACLFRLRRPGDVLEVCKRYRDADATTLYGRALALHQLGRADEAGKAAAKAITAYPLVAKELAKRKHALPAGSMPGYIVVGGPDEAYYYWEEFGEHWERTPGAVALLRSAAKAEGPPAKKA